MTAVAVAVHDPALEALATLFAYPRPGAAETARVARDVVATTSPEAARELDALVAFLAGSDLATCEERFVRTFELNPVCALEIGWQIYGEQYARGTFMIRVQQLLRDVGLDAGSELPDHLPNVLRVLARLGGPSAGRLATHFTAPAVESMVAKLGPSEDNPYSGLLAATALLLRRREEVPSE